jgi:hypothetical protein
MRGVLTGHPYGIVLAAAVYHNDLERLVFEALESVSEYLGFVQCRYDN